ncbi:MAG TPA: hypothetical protein VGK67_06465 [Myxococcales bacterium]|jgi:hypothetical protein
MWHVGWVGLALFVVFCAIAAIAVGPRFKRLGRVFGTPPTAIGALPASGIVVVHGKVVAADAPLPSGPFTGRPVARVEVAVGPRLATKQGHDGIDVKLETVVGARFALEDAQGRRLFVAGEDPTALDALPSEGVADDRALRAFLAANGRQPSDFESTLEHGRYRETAICEGAEIYAWGELREGALRAPAGGTLVLTTEDPRSYRSLIAALKWTFVVFGVISAALVAIGAIGPRLEGPGSLP